MNKCNYILTINEKEFNLFFEIIRLKKNIPEAFYDYIDKISCNYTFTYCIWNSFPSTLNFHSYEQMEYTINNFIDEEIALYYTFNNTEIQPKHFYDKYSNLVLECSKIHPSINIITNNRKLALYIAASYPQYNFIKLYPKLINESDYPYSQYYINDLSEIKKYKFPDFDKFIIEISNCNRNKILFNPEYSKLKLDFENIENYKSLNNNLLFNNIKTMKEFISLEKLKKIIDTGLNNINLISNLSDELDRLEYFLYYLIKPENIQEIRLKLLKYILSSKKM